LTITAEEERSAAVVVALELGEPTIFVHSTRAGRLVFVARAIRCAGAIPLPGEAAAIAALEEQTLVAATIDFVAAVRAVIGTVADKALVDAGAVATGELRDRVTARWRWRWGWIAATTAVGLGAAPGFIVAARAFSRAVAARAYRNAASRGTLEETRFAILSESTAADLVSRRRRRAIIETITDVVGLDAASTAAIEPANETRSGSTRVVLGPATAAAAGAIQLVAAIAALVDAVTGTRGRDAVSVVAGETSRRAVSRLSALLLLRGTAEPVGARQ